MSTVGAKAVDKLANKLFGAIERSETASVRRLWADDIAVRKVDEYFDLAEIATLLGSQQPTGR